MYLPSRLRSTLLSTVFVLVGLSTPSSSRAQIPPQITPPVDNARRVTLAGNVHPLARAEFDRGRAADGQPMTRALLLLKRSAAQETALQSLLEQQQEEASPNYHAWLEPVDFGARYGPADADIQAITGWLTSQGFTVIRVYGGKTLIEFSGNASQVRQAFGTEIHRYEVNGHEYLANAQDPQIPAALAPVVAGIVSLNNFPRKYHAHYLGVARKVPGQAGLQPLFTFPTPSGHSYYGLGPGDFATIYGSKSLITSGNDGTGQTIAIVGETQINVQDVINFRSIFHLPPTFAQSNIILNGEDPGVTSTGEESESDLDVQWSGAVAPGATVHLVVSASTPASAGIDLSAAYIIEHNLAGVMSESYGICESDLGAAGNLFYNSMWEQAAAQGITVAISAGDNGSAGCDDFTLPNPNAATRGTAVSGIASTPFNVAVGGTDFDQRSNPSLYWSATNDSVTGTSALGYIPEIPWNESCAQIGLTGCGASAPQGSVNILAGSGGPSNLYSKPSWQVGVNGVPNDSHRDLPDISFFASAGFNHTAYIICQQDQSISGAQTCDLNTGTGNLDFNLAAGTSAAAPAFAGAIALVNQYQSQHSGSNRQGNANYVLYALAKKSSASCPSAATEAAGCIFNDISKGSSDLPTGGTGIGTNSVPCQGGSQDCSVNSSSGSYGVLVQPGPTGTEAWAATTGYDMATGLGSVNISNLVKSWGTVSTVATTTTLSLSKTTGITHGSSENVNVTVNVKPSSGTASGSVSLIAKFADGTTQGLDQFTLTNGAVNALPTRSLPGGSNYTVTAHYAGDGTNAPSDSAPVTVTVSPESSQTFIVVPTFDSAGNQTNGNATSVPYGSSYILRMYVTDKNALPNLAGPPSPACYDINILTCPTGTVTLTASGNPVDQGTYTLNVAGYTRDIAPTLLGGSYSLVAKYSGDNSYQADSSPRTAFTVTPAASQIQFPQPYPQYLVMGQMTQLSAYVTAPVISNAAIPGGTINFYDGTTLVPGAVSVVTGPGSINAYMNVAFSNQGPRTLTAKYTGDSNYGPVASNSEIIYSLYPTTATQSESATSVNLGQAITLTAVISGHGKNPPMTGNINFYSSSGGNLTQAAPVAGTDPGGNQTLTSIATLTPSNSGVVSVSYPGDTNYGPASTSGDPINVNIPDFGFPPNTNLTDTAGQPGTATLQITPLTNIPSTVTLSVLGGVPFGTTLTFNPGTVNLNGAAVPVTLTLTPNAAAASAVKATLVYRKSGFFTTTRLSWWSLSVVGLVVALYLCKVRRTMRSLRAALLLLLMSVFGFAIGCGGGGGGGGGGGVGGGGGGPYPTTTTVTGPTTNKFAAGVPVTVSAKVSSTGTPTGNVDFYFSGTWVGTTPVLGGTATLNTSVPSPGIYALSATYNGDLQTLRSTSSNLTEYVTGSSTVTITGQTASLIHQANVTVILQ